MRAVFVASVIYLSSIEVVEAYVGPGLGLGAAGALIGALLAVLLALIGVVWYPLKRLFKRVRPRTMAPSKGVPR